MKGSNGCKFFPLKIRWHFLSVGILSPFSFRVFRVFRGSIRTVKVMNSKPKLIPALLAWFAMNARDLPWRHTRNPYAIWVSEIMLQQTQVKTVIPYWERWMRELPTIEAVAKAHSEKIHKLWEGLGYYTRARNLQKAAQQIIARHGGRFPHNFDDVLALPGIGRYTAGAICSIAFNQPTPVLDGNVIRVLTRVFGIGKNPREKKTNARLWKLANELVNQTTYKTQHATRPKSRTRTRDENDDDSAVSHLNQSLMELGALVCTPRNPQCRICPVKKFCVAFRENRVAELPNLGKRIAGTTHHFIAFVVERRRRFLVRQRPAGALNAHLWEFPNAECNSAGAKDVFKSIFGIAAPVIQPLCIVKHSITRHRITLEAFRVHLGGSSSARLKTPNSKLGRRGTPPSEVGGVWLPVAKLDLLPFTGAHKKILTHLKHDGRHLR
jgi:A/G-specific adenine glycosylase